MTAKKTANVTMRVRVGENELEVSGPEGFVEKKIAEFLEKQKAQSYIEPGGTKGKVESRETNKKRKTTSAAQFFRKLGLKTDVGRTLAAGYYLEKYKDYENFTASEAKEVIRAAKINPPSNPNDSIIKNIRKGLIMSAGDKDAKKAFVLTSDGEDEINEMLKD